MKNEEAVSQMFQDLIYSIGTVQTIICHHMHKEEEQVHIKLFNFFYHENCLLSLFFSAIPDSKNSTPLAALLLLKLPDVFFHYLFDNLMMEQK